MKTRLAEALRMLAIASLVGCYNLTGRTLADGGDVAEEPRADVSDASDGSDVADVNDVSDVDDVVDVTDVGDAADVTDSADASDALEVADVSDAPDVADAAEAGCEGGAVMCEGACVDLASSATHCGRCGNACPTRANATSSCSMGACVQECAAGFADCDGDTSNGCEASLSSVMTCGRCGTRCDEPTPLCGEVGGERRCVSGCSASETRCAMSCVNTASDAANCGRCGDACATGATCSSGACACPSGQTDCHGVCRETGASCVVGRGACTRTGAIVCAATGTATQCSATPGVAGTETCNGIDDDCDGTVDGAIAVAACPARANATATCAMGACGFECGAGFADCDGDASNGCEANLNGSARNCGDCGIVCPAVLNGAPACVLGACSLRCASGFHRCGDLCVSDTDVAHCGSLCAPCPVPTNARAATCDGASCGLSCNDGFHACGTRCVANRDLATCGVSCAPCPVPTHGGATCDGVTCGVTCDAGYHACGSVCADSGSVESCGDTCTPCPTPTHGTATCNGRSCGFLCAPGYVASGSACVVAAPRPLTPQSCSWRTTQRPTFRWTDVPGLEQVRLQICRDRGCTTVVVDELIASTASFRPVTGLSVGTWFWRVSGVVAGMQSPSTSPVWEFVVPSRETGVDSGFGLLPDYNGDGLLDLAVGDCSINQWSVYSGITGGVASDPQLVSTSAYGGPAGDVNGDGYCDLLVGGASSSIAAFLGGPSGLGAGRAQGFGRCGSAAGIGDVDGDSFGDVSCGGSSLSVIPGGPTTSGDAVGVTGYIATGAGDVNGDGWYDIAVTEIGATPTVRIYLGSRGALSATPWMSLSLGTGSYREASAIISGDGNGDGISDIAAGDHGSSTARVSIFHGSLTALSSTPQTVISAPSPTVEFGRSMTWARDVTGDDIDDLVIGDFSAASGSGRVYLHPGARSGVSSGAALTFRPVADTGLNFGFFLGGWGDYTGDGRGDLLVGTTGCAAGRAYLFPGASGGPGSSFVRTFNGGAMSRLVP